MRYGLGRSLAETANGTPNANHPSLPVDVVPLKADLLAGPEPGEEGDAEVRLRRSVVSGAGAVGASTRFSTAMKPSMASTSISETR